MRITLLVLVFCLTSACEKTKDGTKETKKNAQEPSNVILKVETESTDKELKIRYSVNNKDQHIIYVFNKPWDRNKVGRLKPAPYEALLSLEEDVYRVGFTIAGLPKDRKVEQRIVPYTTKVLPGAIYKGTIVLPKPLPEYNPYFPVKEGDAAPTNEKAKTLHVELSYIVDKGDAKTKPGVAPGSYNVWSKDLLKKFRTLEHTESLSAEVAKRSGYEAH